MNMIKIITLVFLDISGIILIITYFYLLAILKENDWSYRFLRHFLLFVHLKSMLMKTT